MVQKADLKRLLPWCNYHRNTQSHLVKEIKEVNKHYRYLEVQLANLILHDQSKVVLCLDGTIPVPYKGNTYNIPVRITYPDLYPSIAPIAQVMPTENMILRPSVYVDEDGIVKLKILNNWRPTYNTIQLITHLIAVFSTKMPVFKRLLEGPAQPAPAPAPAPAPVPAPNIAQPPHPQQVREDQERDMCVVCCEYEINTVLLECGHRCMCTICAKKLTNCPICRQPVVRFVTTYNA